MMKKNYSIFASAITTAVILALFLPLLGYSQETQEPKTFSPKALRAMARIYMATDNYDKAEPILEQALSLAKISGSDTELCGSLLDASWLFHKQNNLEKAEEFCELGLKLQQKIYFKDHPYIAYTLRNLGNIHRDQGKYELAISEIEQAITIMHVTHQPDDTVFGPFQADMAKIFVAQGDYQNAQAYYESALKLITAQYGTDNVYTAKIISDFANLHTLTGNYQQAEKLLSRSTTASTQTSLGIGRPLAAAGMRFWGNKTVTDVRQEKTQIRSQIQSIQAGTKSDDTITSLDSTKQTSEISSLLAIAAP